MDPSLVIALLLAPGWAYLCAASAAARRFSRRRLPLATERPGVSVMKPLHGAEPGLYDNLRSFAAQDYPLFQIVLGVNDRNDGAVPAARALIRDLPGCDIVLTTDAPAASGNGKVANLAHMLPAARYDLLVLADSDMRVAPHYLAAVTAPLDEPRVGAVTCLYEGVAADGGLWSRLGALAINFGFLPSALVADALGLGGGCFGATIALRRDTLARIGGFAGLRDELADDYKLGEAVRALGLAVVLSRYIVEARVSEPSLGDLWRHELRWARTVRSVAPAGFFGSVLTQPAAIAGLGVLGTRFDLTACVLLAISCGLRWASARLAARALGFSTRGLWLLPARDALSFAVFVASFFARRVVWRDRQYRIEASGRVRVDGDKAP